MRKHLLTFLLTLTICPAFAQPAFMRQKLYYTGKVWGFVKYYHSEVSVCHVDWDSVLLHVLPAIRNATNDSEFNDALDTMLAAAGPMAIATTPLPDTIAPELKRNRNWAWTMAPILRADVRTVLDTIKHNFRPHPGCWAMDNTYTTSYGGWLVFPHDSLELNINTTTAYPDQDHRMLLFYKYWNIMRYFNPYNYVLDMPVDSILSSYVLPMANVSAAPALFNLYQKIATRFDDAHVYGTSYSTMIQMLPGFYKPYLRLNYIGGQYVVVKSSVAGIAVGDALLSVDGLTTTQWEDSLRQYFSSGNPSVFRRTMCSQMLGRLAIGTPETMVLEDSTGTSYTATANCVWPPADQPFFYSDIYPADSLSSIVWTTMQCDIGYVNMGNLQSANVTPMYSDLQNKSAIIFDIRNYPNGTAWDIANLMYPSHREFAKDMEPDVTYPGTYTWYHDYLGYNGNPTAYTGKVIILMNQETQSQAEYSTMILSAMPNVVRVGSQTAGADGNITYWKITQDLTAGFTTLGIYYPNGDSTQRIGIVPDSVIYPTRAGIRHNQDEVLEKALTIGGCDLAVSNTTNPARSLRLTPNPATDIITLAAANIGTGNITVTITDVLGKTMLQNEVVNSNNSATATFDIRQFAAGLYFVTVQAGSRRYITKLVKQ